MNYYAGIDVSVECSSVCVVDASGKIVREAKVETTPPMHIAFLARTRAEVRAFHQAALRAGGRDNGAPGLRPQYHPNYYGAFVLDLDGHNVEAVCHRPE